TFAMAAARDHCSVAETDERLRLQQHVDGTDDYHRAFARPQAETCLVKSKQCRRTGRIYRKAWAMKVEEVGDPVCCHTERASGIDVRTTFSRRAEIVLHVGIVMAGDSDKDAGIRAGQELRHQRGILQRFPRKLEQQTLLRINKGGLARRYAEKICVEEVDLIEQP